MPHVAQCIRAAKACIYVYIHMNKHIKPHTQVIMAEISAETETHMSIHTHTKIYLERHS